MNASSDTATQSTARATVLFAVLLLFFFQLTGAWIESIYRMSLVKLRMGSELYGALLVLAPVAVFFAHERRERGVLWTSIVVLMAARVLLPMLDAPAQIVVAGLGAAAFLVVLSFALSQRYRWIAGDAGAALGVAILLSIALRSWGSSVDVSMEGPGVAIGWMLALAAYVLFCIGMQTDLTPEAPQPVAWWRSAPALVGLFANFSIVLLVLASPGVVNAWSAGGAGGYRAAVAIAAAGFAAALVLGVVPARAPAWAVTACFVAALVGGLLVHAPHLPMSVSASPVTVGEDTPAARVTLYLALLLAPVVILNVRHCMLCACFKRPRNAVLPVLLGMLLLFAVTMLLIFTNTWGYVPYGPAFRNKFYLPFAIAGIGALLPWLRRGIAIPPARPVRAVRVITLVLAAFAIAGLVWRGSTKPQPRTDPRRLTIMTYNYQQGSNAAGNRDYRGQLALLRKVNPDIVGLQESDTARPSGGNVDSVRYFADGLGYYTYYGPNTVSGTFGTAILSRFPIRNPRAFFTFSDSDEVATAEAEIDVDGKTVAFFSNHPSGADEVMNAHVDALIAEAGKYERVIAVGDFNFRPHTSYFRRLAKVLGPSAAILGESRVDNNGQPVDLAREIDHIFVSRNFEVLESHYLPPPDSHTDHPAHWSVIRMKE